jgi:hypothetical protein
MAIHNFIRDSALADDDFDRYENDENYALEAEEVASSSQANGGQQNGASTRQVDEYQTMNQFRDWIANGLLMRS